MSSLASAVIPRLGDRSLFSALSVAAYANHAGISPPSDPVQAAIAAMLSAVAAGGSLGFGASLVARESARAKLAKLIGAGSDDVALMPNTMYGLASVALSIPWKQGERIIAFSGEYPSNVVPFQRAAELFGLTLTLLPVADFARPMAADLSRLTAELARGGVRLCAVSAVQFQTGLHMPLAKIAALCHAHGAELVVDGVQALGAVPLDVQALDLDYLAAGSHKWLMGIDGGGMLYVHPRCMPKLRPAITGNMSYVGGLDMLLTGAGHLRYDRTLRTDARVFEGGMLSSAAAAALDASLGLMLTLGIPAIHRHVNDYLNQLEPLLVERGFTSLRLADEERRSCTLSLAPPAGLTAPVLAAELGKRGVLCSCPDGLLRFSPHWPNSLSEVPLIIDALDDAMRAGSR